MYATTLIAIFLLHVGFLVAFPALWLTWRALAPGWIAASERAVRFRPILTVAVGVLVGGAWFLVSFGLSAAPPALAKFLGALGFMFLGLYGMAGISAFAANLGRNLPSPADLDRPWKATLRGGIPLELTWVLPVVGWFILLPLSLVVGVGAATLGLFGAAADRAARSAPAAGAGEFARFEHPEQSPAALHA
jgi:hypothetical protein